MQPWKQCALPVITTMALWQPMHLGTWCTVTHCWYRWTKDSSHFQSENVKKKPKKSLYSYIGFFHKVLHDFEVKNSICSIKRIELSVKFKLFQWCHDLFTVLCLSLDWKIRFNLDFFLKSFRCSKRDVWHVLLKTLRNDPTKLS